MRAQRIALAAAGALLLAAVAVGAVLRARGVAVKADAAPLFAIWDPRVGVGTVLAAAVAALVVGWGPLLARTLAWRAAALTAWAAATAWTLALALVDGWTGGVARPLERPDEYLTTAASVDLPDLLSGFAERIVAGQPDAWPTHVASHPPGALAVFAGLDRAGLSGGTWAGIVCVVAGCTALLAVASTVRRLADEDAARTVLLIGVLVPGAIWVGVSADALFLAASAWGVALLAQGCVRDGARGDVLAFVGGLVLGASMYLSYGVVLVWVVAGAVVVVTRRPRALVLALVGAGVVVGAVTLAGFSWSQGYQLVKVRYLQGFGGVRPYAYWVWANLAALAVAVGPAVVAGVGRALALVPPEIAAWRARQPRPSTAVVALAAAGLACVAVATASGLSKAEVERIWLPFGAWIAVATALLPVRSVRWWLAAQAGTALVVTHLLRTLW